MKVCACVCTYHRPDLIVRCVESLRAQNGLDERDFSIIVVDNSHKATARKVIGPVASTDGRIVFIHEPTPGVVAARNAALDAARRKGCQVALFTDDDCIVPPSWVADGAKGLRRARVPFVGGPVLSPGQSDRSSRDSRKSRGIRSAPTSNLALDMQLLGELRFDPRFTRTGGEDRYLTLELSRRHGPGIHLAGWTVVHDEPEERSSTKARVAKFRAAPLAHVRALWWSGYRGRAVTYVAGGIRYPILFAMLAAASLLPLPSKLRRKISGKTAKYKGRTLGILALLRRHEHDYF